MIYGKCQEKTEGKQENYEYVGRRQETGNGKQEKGELKFHLVLTVKDKCWMKKYRVIWNEL